MSIVKTISKIKHNYIWNNKFIFLSLLSNFLFCILFFVLIFITTKGRTDVVPLNYNIYFGADNFGPIKNFFVFPQICLGVFLINSFLCYYYYKYSRILSYFLVATSFVVNILMIFSFILLILFIEL